jgi:hypothetical protein
MFTAEQIWERLRQQPFRPFRIIASEGLRFNIEHPELLHVGRRDLIIGLPDADNPAIYDDIMRVALAHVVALEDLPATKSSATNGPPG